MPRPRLFFLGIAIALLAIALDQASKWFLLEMVNLPNRPPIDVTFFFNLVSWWNHGISFGMFGGAKQAWPLLTLSGVIVLLLLNWLRRVQLRLLACALGCVIGGAVSNMIDRVHFGAVADFFHFHLGNYEFPAFNVADSTIFIGVVLLCIHSMFVPDQPEGATS